MTDQPFEKFMEGGTGQVFYVTPDADARVWQVEMFVGGSVYRQPIAAFDTRDKAVEFLSDRGCIPIPKH